MKTKSIRHRQTQPVTNSHRVLSRLINIHEFVRFTVTYLRDKESFPRASFSYTLTELSFNYHKLVSRVNVEQCFGTYRFNYVKRDTDLRHCTQMNQFYRSRTYRESAWTLRMGCTLWCNTIFVKTIVSVYISCCTICARTSSSKICQLRLTLATR